MYENARRHAFVGREEGEIRVCYGRHRNGRLHLTVTDDGIGGLGEAKSGTGLGNSIVAALAGQLSGEVATENGDAGTAVTVLFDTDAGEEKK